VPEHDALDAGLAEVASEIARADSKAAALLAALGLPIAVLAAAVPGRDLPLAAGICITAAALTLAAAMGLTLLALRPSLPPPGQDDGAGLVGTQQAVCHIAVCGVCGYAWDEDGEYGAYHYSSPEEAIRGATSEDPEHAFKQLPDGSLLCRRSDRAHQQVLGAVLATEAETRLHERLAADGQERITTDHPHT